MPKTKIVSIRRLDWSLYHNVTSATITLRCKCGTELREVSVLVEHFRRTDQLVMLSPLSMEVHGMTSDQLLTLLAPIIRALGEFEVDCQEHYRRKKRS